MKGEICILFMDELVHQWHLLMIIISVMKMGVLATNEYIHRSGASHARSQIELERITHLLGLTGVAGLEV